VLPRSRSPVPSPGRFGCATADYVDCAQAALGSRHRPGTAPGPANDRPSPLRAPAGDPTPITQVKVRTRAKSTTGFSLCKPVPSLKTGYRFSGSRLTSLITTPLNIRSSASLKLIRVFVQCTFCFREGSQSWAVSNITISTKTSICCLPFLHCCCVANLHRCRVFITGPLFLILPVSLFIFTQL